jgi:hypothetical protein
MQRAIFSILIVCLVQLGFGQNKAATAGIQPPADSSKLILHAYAKGVQMYRCTADPKDSSHYVWTFTGPRADLFADNNYSQLIGKHHAGADKNPVWEDKDGSMVAGLKLRQASAPDNLAIPWLLLKRIATTGSGILTSALYIQRINTTGGKAPSTAGKQDNGKMLDVPYTAEYLFYGAN